MRKNRMIELIEEYGDNFDPDQDISIAEIMNILDGSRSKMDIAEYSYLYGHMKGSSVYVNTEKVPLYSLKQMTDDEWNALAARNKAESFRLLNFKESPCFSRQEQG